MKILVLGTSGMIGNTIFRVLSQRKSWEVFGTVRDISIKVYFPNSIQKNIIAGIDVDCNDLGKLFENVHPDVVINCIGLTKHLPEANDPLRVIPLNSLLPHRLSKYCDENGSRLIHISTDCVFSGKKGQYTEGDPSDATDIYGKSKYLGEVIDTKAITLRTSTIGHEINTEHGLLEWFLSQQGRCKGYTSAIFSGLPTVTLAEVIRDHVILAKHLSGLYHVAGSAISKYNLLKIIAKEYNKTIDIERDESFEIDRSLIADKFQKATGYVAPDWPNLIKSMHNYH